VGDYDYRVTWEKGEGWFNLRTRWRDDRWQLLGMAFRSAVLNVEATTKPETRPDSDS